MKKLTFLALSLVGVSLLTACSSYTNGNELEEEDKYIRPEGVHELADFLTQFDTKYTMITTLNNNVSIVNVDGTIKKSVVDGVEYYEELEDARYYLYNQDTSFYTINVESQLAIPFDFLDVEFTDFIEYEESYALSNEKLEEYNIDSLIVTYDINKSNILFTTTKGDDVFESFIDGGVNLQIPQNDFSLELYGIADVKAMLIDSNYDSYTTRANALSFPLEPLYTYHTAQYSDYTFFLYGVNAVVWHVVGYDNREVSLVRSQYDHLLGSDNAGALNDIATNSLITLNMFVCDESIDLYERILLSHYNEETGSYIYKSETRHEEYKFNDDFTEITYTDYTSYVFKYDLYNFGTTTTDDFIHSLPVVTTLGYTNLIK